MAPSSNQSQYLEGQGYLNCSESTSAKIDAAVQALLTQVYEDAKSTLIENRALLDEISEYLLTKETITGEELMAFINADKKKKQAGDEAVEETE